MAPPNSSGHPFSNSVGKISMASSYGSTAVPSKTVGGSATEEDAGVTPLQASAEGTTDKGAVPIDMRYGLDQDTSPKDTTPLVGSRDAPSDDESVATAEFSFSDQVAPEVGPPVSPGKRRMMRHGTSFFEDLTEFNEGTIPQSIVIGFVIGIVCGLAACLYYKILEFGLEYLWHTLPEKLVVDQWSEHLYWTWIPLIGTVMAVCVGLSVKLLGEPGDLAYTIQCVHDKAYIAMNHVLPMVAASQFSILGGGSLGPEAPLVAICAALGGFISRTIFRQKSRNVVRKHTLMGMAAALAAFFGCPLGGSLFALEVNSRFGVEYFEHTIEAIFCGEVCLVVFRAAAGLTIGPIWDFGTDPLPDAHAIMVIVGALIGLCGAAIAAAFAWCHWQVMDMFKSNNLLDNRNAIQRALLGAVVILTAGTLIPHTMFWGEYEFQTIWTLSPAKDLKHVFPTSGLLGFEISSCLTAVIAGICKMIAISFTVAGGYRGGFIFPLFAAGAAFGRALVFLIPAIPAPVACLCFAAALNVAITRTSLATSIILVYLSGEQNAMSPVLAASLVSLFATSYMPFIKSQIVRNDLDHSLFFEEPDEIDE